MFLNTLSIATVETAGADLINGNGGDDIIFGDHGLVTQSSLKLLSTDNVISIETANPAEGGADTIHGDLGNDIILGGNGADSITGNGDDDIIFGDHGKVTVSLGTVTLIQTTDVDYGDNDIIEGNAGTDVILGGYGADDISADDAADSGNDVVLGDFGVVARNDGQTDANDIYSTDFASGGDDTISAGDGANTVIGGAGSDSITAGNGDNVVIGDSGSIIRNAADVIEQIKTVAPARGGNDTISIGSGSNRVLGGPLNDAITIAGGSNVVLADDGFIDYISLDANPADIDRIWSTDTSDGGADTITTGIGRDIILGGAAGDKIDAFGDGGTATDDGNNIVFGDYGLVDYLSDELAQGSSSNPGLEAYVNGAAAISDANNPVCLADIDRVESTSTGLGGNDTIDTGDRNDIIIGGFGNDTIHAGHGKNIVFGDAGRITAATSDDPAVQISVHQFTIGEIVSTAYSDGGTDTVTSGDQDDIIIGGREGDTLDAGKGDNVVLGDHGQILTLTNLGINNVIGDPRPAGDHPLTHALIKSIVPDGEIGGADTITTGIGRDIIIGGAGGDTIQAFVSKSLGSVAGTAAQDGNNVIFGDYGLVDYLSEELAQGDPANPALETYVRTNTAVSASNNAVRAADIDRIWSLANATALGGADTITTGDRNDIVIGGVGNDVIDGGNGSNIAVGDNVKITAAPKDMPTTAFSVHEFTICQIETIGFADADSGNDLITSGSPNDVLFGGGGNDSIYAGGGDDLVFGDQGRTQCMNGQPYDPTTHLRPICWNDFPTLGFLLFEATNVTQTTGAGSDLIFGQDGSDVILGEQCGDTLYGGNGDDALIGGSNVSGALDTGDRIDGGAGNDAIAGDNAQICYRPDAIDLRMRVLDGTALYGITEGVDNGLALIGVGAANSNNVIDPTQPALNAMPDPRYAARTADPSSGHAEYRITLLDHADNTPTNLYGNDYIAGGGGEDEIFGQLGNDVIQGDGTIGVAKVYHNGIPDPAAFAQNLAAAQLSSTRTDGTFFSVTDLTSFGANRGPVPTELSSFGFTMDPLQDLQVQPSFEGVDDGDDYIEGNGGNDVIFGNGGQDDIIGGSSDLFGLIDPIRRPDGSDLLFGGAGTDISRNDIGDASTGRSVNLPIGAPNDLISTAPGGHAHDADVIIGDNGRIVRLVGVNKTPRATSGDVYDMTGVRSTDGFLNFNYDYNGLAAEGYGSDGNAATYDRIIVRAVEFLDYHEGGIDVNAAAANDRGAADEIHGESGDDSVYGMKGNDVLYGEGQDDDLVGGYGNDWVSGGTGNDGVIGDDGRIMTSRNATAYGEPLHGVLKLLPDNHDTRTFNGNMMDEAIATPGSIQQAVVNVGGELKKAVNLTPFSFDTTFDGRCDEFTTVHRKTVDDQGKPDAHNADDIIFGGLGNDWLHGGSGDDAISGGEALGMAFTQIYNSASLAGVARSDYGRPFNPVDALRYNPQDINSWHYDRTRRSGEFALYDEYDPMRKITLNMEDGRANTGDAGGVEWFLNFATSEGTYVPGGTIPGATGQQATTYLQAWNDGNDRIFGDTGNDWLVGGTGRDDLYGGFGNDLLNADDDHSTDLLRNDQPDTQPSYEDRAFGGGGRDVLIGNTGGDRLIDWVGEFNSYLVPFAPFGMATVSRTLQPQLAEFLYTLSASDGADPTRWTDTNGELSLKFRNGEPEGELGVVRQQDFAWQTQTGAPTDPQAGNIPGGKRDVLRSSSFNDGTMQAFAPDSGTWTVQNGALQVSAPSLHGDAVAVYDIGDSNGLPSYFEVQASISVAKPLAGWKANSYIIFDYQSPTSFKFTGIDIALNKLVMGHRDSTGWIVDQQVPFQAKPDTFYNMLLAVNGLTASLVVDNATVFTQTYAARIVDDYAYGLNWGLIGFGSDNSQGAMDNVAVQVLPPQVTYSAFDDFSDGRADLFTGDSSGSWLVQNNRFAGAPSPGYSVGFHTVALPGVQNLQAASNVDLAVVINTSAEAGFIFDRYSASDFKFAALDATADKILIGHHTIRSGWVIDGAASWVIDAGVNYMLGLSLRGSTVNVTINGQTIVSHAFNAVTVDGGFGLFTRNAAASFDDFSIQADDSAFNSPNHLPAALDDAASTAIDTPVTIHVLNNDTDPDRNGFTILSFTQPAFGTVSLNVDATFTYTPNGGFAGADQFTYIITDGVSESTPATVRIQVGGTANNAPVAINDTASTTKGVPVTIPVLANDNDADGNVLGVLIATIPANGSVKVNADGTVTYTPNAGFVGTDTFTYLASDGIAQSSPATVTVGVRNQAPIAVSDTARTNKAVAVNIPVMANDSDPDGDVITISGLTLPTKGTAIVTSNGTILYTPKSSFTSGTDTFTYRVTDGSAQSNAATVTITINTAPTASADTATTNKDVPVTIAVLANDRDANGDVLSVTSLTQPANGTVTLNADKTVTYTPKPGFAGTDKFTYKASDGATSSNVATVIVQVLTVANIAPVAVNDAATTNRNVPVNIPVLNNDTDANGDVLTVAALTQPANGTAVLNQNGTVTYTPKSGFVGTDSFTYCASDGQAQSGAATVSVQVKLPTPVITSYSNTTQKSIADLGITRSTIAISDAYTIQDINVQLNITHPRDSDLQVFLIAPDGTTIQLFSNLATSGQNFQSTVFDDEATSSITGGSAPFTGTYRPTGNLTSLEGKSVTGVWTLEVRDTVRRQTGTSNNWSLMITHDPQP